MARLVGILGVDVPNGHQVRLDISGRAVTFAASVCAEREVIVSLYQTTVRFFPKEVPSINANAMALDLLCRELEKLNAACNSWKPGQQNY